MSEFRLPGPAHRTSIVGMTGSGKTRFAAWLFARSAEFSKRPYVIVDFKGDDLLEQIERARPITVRDTPKAPGLYYLNPLPHEQEEMADFLWRIWKRGNIGLYIDEGYMIRPFSPAEKALNAILTQGRSKRIPATILTQRPTSCSRFIFSEANFFAYFYLNDERDQKTVSAFTPRNSVWDYSRPLPDYHCRWYDIGRRYSCVVRPVPKDAEILQLYDDALKVKVRGI